MDTPPEQIGEENMDVTLRCEVKGGDKTVLIWTSEGRELQRNNLGLFSLGTFALLKKKFVHELLDFKQRRNR